MRLQVVEKLAHRGALEKYPPQRLPERPGRDKWQSEHRPQKGWAPGARERGEGRLLRPHSSSVIRLEKLPKIDQDNVRVLHVRHTRMIEPRDFSQFRPEERYP